MKTWMKWLLAGLFLLLLGVIQFIPGGGDGAPPAPQTDTTAPP